MKRTLALLVALSGVSLAQTPIEVVGNLASRMNLVREKSSVCSQVDTMLKSSTKKFGNDFKYLATHNFTTTTTASVQQPISDVYTNIAGMVPTESWVKQGEGFVRMYRHKSSNKHAYSLWISPRSSDQFAGSSVCISVFSLGK